MLKDIIAVLIGAAVSWGTIYFTYRNVDKPMLELEEKRVNIEIDKAKLEKEKAQLDLQRIQREFNLAELEHKKFLSEQHDKALKFLEDEKLVPKIIILKCERHGNFTLKTSTYLFTKIICTFNNDGIGVVRINEIKKQKNIIEINYPLNNVVWIGNAKNAQFEFYAAIENNAFPIYFDVITTADPALIKYSQTIYPNVKDEIYNKFRVTTKNVSA